MIGIIKTSLNIKCVCDFMSHIYNIFKYYYDPDIVVIWKSIMKEGDVIVWQVDKG